jgi:hypothetical protein
MNGPSLAPILIPVIGTLLLIVWLILVFAAGRHAERAGIRERGGRSGEMRGRARRRAAA